MSPAYTTIRQWLLKIGLYKIQSPKTDSKDCFFIIDTSIQMGPQKCVVILRLNKSNVNTNFCPTFEDVDVLVVRPLCNCPGEVINDLLEEARNIVNVDPTAIISDEGSENKKGCGIFIKNHPNTIHLYDASHKINNCLKQELNNDELWLAFKADASAAIQKLKLSSIAHLAPPKQRAKDRMHSAFPLIEWGLQVLNLMNSEQGKALSDEEREKMNWIYKYQFSLLKYIEFKSMCTTALNITHKHGYYKGVTNAFISHTGQLCNDNRCTSFRNRLGEVLRAEEQKLPTDEHYQASTEVLESLFGKFKDIEGTTQASSGLSSLILAIPALTGGLSRAIVEKALATVSISHVDEWVEKNMGETYRSKRRSALAKIEIADIEIADIDKGSDDADMDLELCDFY
jgi:hypothetical protein